MSTEDTAQSTLEEFASIWAEKLLNQIVTSKVLDHELLKEFILQAALQGHNVGKLAGQLEATEQFTVGGSVFARHRRPYVLG